jgi:tripartite-type tricarboxylate transporter receptor subunit TctC
MTDHGGQMCLFPSTIGDPREAMPPFVADCLKEASALFGVGAPKNTPKEVIAKLNKEINEILAEPAIKARLTELGGEPLIGPPEVFGKMIVAETEKWKKVIEEAKVEKVQ